MLGVGGWALSSGLGFSPRFFAGISNNQLQRRKDEDEEDKRKLAICRKKFAHASHRFQLTQVGTLLAAGESLPESFPGCEKRPLLLVYPTSFARTLPGV